MQNTLRFKLTTAFLLVTLIAFSLVGIIANVILEKQFEKYAIDNLNQKNTQTIATLEERYGGWGNQWDLPGLENIGVSALSDGLILRIGDKDGKVLWDAMAHNSGMCVEMLHSMADNMKYKNGKFNGGYTEKSYPLTLNGSIIGNVTIGYYGPYFYTSNDLSFLNTLNKLLILAMAIVGTLALIFGTYLAKRLSSPISRVIKTAEQISEGNYDDRVTEKSNTHEIIELTGAINTLADNLGRQEMLRKRLTADVAHELRTPIANLQSHLEAMIDGVWKPGPDRLKSCHEEAVRLSKIVGDLETLARYDGENVILQKERFELTELIQTAALSFETECKTKNILLATNLAKQYITADKDKIMQVLINLLSNALKYTNEGGKIEVTTGGNDKSAWIAVKDSGLGISQEDLPFIFERFYRADRSRSRATGGSGIGLAVAKSLVTAHGGTLSVESVLGIGSEFIVLLPKQ